ncbi:MAG: hypothetical protein ABEJ59_05640 [Halanaeroarchaeum sp.]
MSEHRRAAARRVAVVVGIALVASAAVSLLVEPQVRGPGMGPGAMHPAGTAYFQARLFISTFNVVVLFALTGSYLGLYRELPTRFTGSLLLFSVALTLYALSANPAVQVLFGFRGGTGLGPFTFLPDLFASVAVVVLLYQSYQ